MIQQLTIYVLQPGGTEMQGSSIIGGARAGSIQVQSVNPDGSVVFVKAGVTYTAKPKVQA